MKVALFLVLTSACNVTFDAGDRAPTTNNAVDGEGEGEGDGSCAHFVVTPAACDAGEVDVGAAGPCALALSNLAGPDVIIDDIGFSPGTPTDVFTLNVAIVPIPIVIVAGTTILWSLDATPKAFGPVEGDLVFSSNDCDEPTKTVPLRVTGVLAPTALARIKSVGGVAAGAAPALQPGDDVVVSGDASTAGAGATITAYHWDLSGFPAGSHAVVAAPDSVDTGFVHDGLTGLDVAGTYSLELVVTDSTGTSSRSASLPLTLVQHTALDVGLAFDGADDVELHFVKGSAAAWCTLDDCDPADCVVGASPLADWTGPLLTNGGATFVGDQLPDDTYELGVFVRSASAPVTPSVQAFLHGALADDWSATLDAGDLWTVARIDVVNGVATVTTVDTVAAALTCP